MRGSRRLHARADAHSDTTLIDLAAGGTPVDLEFAYTLSAQARKQGVVMLRPEDVHDHWLRQAIINEANRLYGQRPGGEQ